MAAAGGAIEATGFRHFGTSLTETVGGIFGAVFAGNAYLINLGFQAIAFAGLYKLLMTIEPRLRRWLAIILLLPSFNLWTSVASKEALVTAAFCAILIIFVRLETASRVNVVAFILLIVIIAALKPHYSVAILFLFFAILVTRRIRQRATAAFLVAITSLIPLVWGADFLDQQSRIVAGHFRFGENTLTREMFFVDTNDIFLQAPYGMFQSFFGPTVSEAVIGPLQMVSFVESIILLIVLGGLLIPRILDRRAYEFIVGTFTLFWILFPSYPFGIMNPGSAVRYRSGYIVLVAFVVVFLMLRDGNRTRRTAQPKGSIRATRPTAASSAS